MTRIEDLVRDSLRQRAEDVEPTPALWREVDRRIARHRRFQVTTWSLAAVAAALAAFVVVPGLLGGADPSRLEIEPMGPTGGVMPTVAVVAGSDGLDLLDLATGERTALDVPIDGPVAQLTVRPGSTAEDFDIALVQTPDDSGATLTLVYNRQEGGVVSTAEESGVAGFVPTVRWSPDGDHVAYTEPGDDGRVRLLVGPAPLAPDVTEEGQMEASLDGFLSPAEATEITTLGTGDALLDWVLTEQEGLSELWIAQADGTVGLLRLSATGGAGGFAAASDEGPVVPDGWSGNPETMVTDVAVAVSADPSAPTGGQPVYLLAPGTDDGPSLYWSGLPDRATGLLSAVEVPLGSRVGDVGLDTLRLDAEQDAALVGDGGRTWLATHDGDGDFGPLVEVPDATAGALFGAPSRGPVDEQPTEDAAPAEPEPTDEPTDEVADEATGAEPAPAPGEDAGTATGLPGPVVVTRPDELVLIGPDGEQTLMSLDDAGESRFVSARVRPGSTLDDLTVVALTSSEGLYDLWDIRVVDGQVTRDALSGAYAPAVNSPAGEGVAVNGPVWSPDGDKLAWFEFGTGPATLRTIGWDEGPGTGVPATDNAQFEIEGLPSRSMMPMEWVEVPEAGGLTEIRGTLLDFAEGYLAVPLEIQADGALVLLAGQWAMVEPVPSAFGSDSPVGAVASRPGDPAISHAVLSTLDGVELVFDPYAEARSVTLPAEILPGDGLPEYWVRAFGDGALVGSPNVALAWFVTPDGSIVSLPGSVVDADVVR